MNKYENIYLAYYKTSPHFDNLYDPLKYNGPLFNYLTKVIAPLMKVNFVFKSQISTKEIRNVARDKSIDITIGVFNSKSNGQFYLFSHKPLFQSKAAIFVKNKPTKKMPNDWILGHYPTDKTQVLPYIKKIAPNITFLTPRDWIYRGIKMLNSERIDALFGLSKLEVFCEFSRFKKDNSLGCIDLPMKPIDFYLGFNKKSLKHKRLLKKYNEVTKNSLITYNKFLENYYAKRKIRVFNCELSLDLFKNKDLKHAY